MNHAYVGFFITIYPKGLVKCYTAILNNQKKETYMLALTWQLESL